MNQCDGCKLNLPVENGIHVHPDKIGWERLHMTCTKGKYKKPPVKCDTPIGKYEPLLKFNDGLRHPDHMEF
jgi:hypothetical protein